jgi:ribosome-binding ATPase YchF (GTP1/OBG family)
MRYDLEEIDVKLRRLETQLEQMKKEFTPIGRHMLVEIRTLTKAWECLLGRDRVGLTEEQKSEMRRKGKSLEIRVEFPEVLDGVPLRFATWTPIETEVLKKYSFFTSKEMIYLLNVSTRDHLRGNSKWAEPLRAELDNGKLGGGQLLFLSCLFEWSLRVLGKNGTLSGYFEANPLHEEASHNRGAPALLYACARTLDLVTFYTFNEESKDFKVWYCRQGTNIKDAANLIDYEMYKFFQRGEVYNYDDIVEFKGDFALLDEFGKRRHQVKSYTIGDGDLIFFKSYSPT